MAKIINYQFIIVSIKIEIIIISIPITKAIGGDGTLSLNIIIKNTYVYELNVKIKPIMIEYLSIALIIVINKIPFTCMPIPDDISAVRPTNSDQRFIWINRNTHTQALNKTVTAVALANHKNSKMSMLMFHHLN